MIEEWDKLFTTEDDPEVELVELPYVWPMNNVVPYSTRWKTEDTVKGS